MRKCFEKYKLPLGITISVVLIISLAALISAIYSGRESAIAAMSEDFSMIEENSDLSVCDVLSSVQPLFLPEKYKEEKAESVNTVTCKKYTEYTVSTKNGTVTVRNYNYAYLKEDEPVKIPDDAKKIYKDNAEIFVYKDKNNNSTALYYNGLSRYIITDTCSADEMISIFEH